MWRFIGGLLVCMVMLASISCRSSGRSQQYNKNYWNWPNYEGADSYVESAPHPKNRNYAMPVEPSLEHEAKFYGVPESDWHSMTPLQQKHARQLYEKKHAD